MEVKTVLVTGSSRGIGKAIATAFAVKGYNVVLNCKERKEEMEQVVEMLREQNPNVIGIQCDVSDATQRQGMFDEIENTFGGVDILVNNAAVSYIGLFNEMVENQWQQMIQTNLLSVVGCTHRVIQKMIPKKEGIILNISSIWGQSGASCETIYAMTKGGVNTFTKSLAKELGPCNIRVNAISCGFIDTEMNDILSAEEKAAFVEQIPLMRMGKPSDVAALCVFLASSEAQYITGQILGVDGGY